MPAPFRRLLTDEFVERFPPNTRDECVLPLEHTPPFVLQTQSRYHPTEGCA